MREKLIKHLLSKGYNLKQATVLYLLHQGLDVATISERMGMAKYSVKSSFYKVYQEEGFKNRSELKDWLNKQVEEIQ